MAGKTQAVTATARTRQPLLTESARERLSDFARKIRQAQGRSGSPAPVLLVGPKTQTSAAVTLMAEKIGVEVLRVDLSQVVSKFIGETEKNLDAVFRQAEDQGAILLLDEAEALFGKRTDVRDSHDRFANAEALLERMNRFPGVAVLAAGRKTSLDPPFTRRFRFSMELPTRSRNTV